MATYSAVQERLTLACTNLIAGLLPSSLLPGLRPDRVYAQMLPNDNPVWFPGVLVTMEGQAEELDTYLSEGVDAVWRPMVIATLDRSDEDYLKNRGQHLLWRESLMRIFRKPVKSSGIRVTVPETLMSKLVPEFIVDQAMAQSGAYQLFRTAFVVRFWCLEPRGLAAQTG